MLVLSRRVGEEVVIAGNIRLTILDTRGERVRIGIAAPPAVEVHRREVHDRGAEPVGQPTLSEATQPR